MRKLRNFLAAMILMLAALTMSGCKAGSSIDTTLTVNQDMSGSRVMKIAIDDSVVQENFSGTMEQLQELVKTTCPADLSWSYDDSEGVKTFTFVMNFTGIDDYKTKVSNLLGGERQITMEAPDSIWVNGVNIQEDFTSQDLMDWLKTAVVEAGFVTSENAGQVFSMGSTEVVYNGESRSSGNYVNVNTISYLKLNSVKLFIEVLDMSSYHVSLRFEVPESSMSAKGDEIRAYIQSVAPADSEQKEETLSDGGVAFVIGKQFIDQAGLVSFCQSVFGGENASFTEVEDGKAGTPFEFVQCNEMKINLSNYVSSQGYGTDFYVLMKTPSGYSSTVNGNAGYDYDATNYPGYKLMESCGMYGDERTFVLKVMKSFAVSQLDVETTQKMGSKWKRATTFVLAEVPKDEELALMVSRFEERVGKVQEETEETPEQSETVESGEATEASESTAESEEKKEPEYSVKIESEKKDGASIVITQTGQDYELNRSAALLFGGSWELTCAEEKGFAKVKKDKVVVDKVDYSRVLSSLPENFVMNYELKLAGINSFEYTNVSDDYLKEQTGGSLEAAFTDTNAKVEWVGTSTDLLAVLFWVLIAAGCVMLVIGVLKSGVFAFTKKEPVTAPELSPVPDAEVSQPVLTGTPQSPTETAATTEAASTVETNAENTSTVETDAENAPAQTAPEEAKPATETAEPVSAAKPAFCEECGAPLPEEGLFCEKCGAKIKRGE